MITTTIVIRTPDGASLEGAPYDLYAPTASQAAIQPYRSGFVGQGNTIRLDDLPAGRYRLLVHSNETNPLDTTIDFTSVDANVVLDADPTSRNGGTIHVMPSLGGSQDTPTDGTSGALNMNGSADSPIYVTSLPSTGSGSSIQGGLLMVIAASLGSTFLAAGSAVRFWTNRRRPQIRHRA